MRRLLLVTYYFPPLGGPGVFRPLRFARYLPRHGWDVTVLTVRASIRVLKDDSLTGDVPPDLRVERTGTLEPRNLLIVLNRAGLASWTARIEDWLMLPDDQRGWVPFALRRARKVLSGADHDAVLTTSAPYSAHLVGRAIRRRTGIRWIADFRDEWTTNPYLEPRYPTRFHLRRNRRMEESVLREADAVLSVSRPWLAAHRSLVDDQPGEKFHVVPNGFDGEHFPSGPAPPPDRFRVAYTGMFYGHRSPRSFLEGLRRALERGWLPRDETEVVFMGHGSEGHAPPGLPDGLFRAIGHRTYRESLALLREAAALLLVVPAQGGAGNHTGKLFPYLASGRPILLQAPEPNVAADLIRESGSGVVVPPDDPDRVAGALRDLHGAWRNGRSPALRKPEVIARYEADRQVRDLAALLERIVAGPGPASSGLPSRDGGPMVSVGGVAPSSP